MAIKKYLSLDKLTEYDVLLKAKIAADDAAILEQAKNDASNQDAVVLAETQKYIDEVQIAIDNLSNDFSAHNHDNNYDSKGAADAALATAKTYADDVVAAVKNDLLNGAGAAYDTLKELGDLIDDNTDAINALETIASGKANASHTHTISEVSELQSVLDEKVTIEALTNAINDVKKDASNQDAVVLAEAQKNVDAVQTNLDTHIADDTRHITSVERTNWEEAYAHAQSAHAPLDAQANVIESIKVNGVSQTITNKGVDIAVPTQASDIGAAAVGHTHAISDIANLQTTLNNASSAISANTGSITALTDRTLALETKVGDGFEEITSAEIQGLFA